MIPLGMQWVKGARCSLRANIHFQEQERQGKEIEKNISYIRKNEAVKNEEDAEEFLAAFGEIVPEENGRVPFGCAAFGVRRVDVFVRA